MQPKISIIIPYFNTELYLERCINSLISQSYTNLEIILVNDGSTDQSPVIAERFAAKDKRFQNITITNSGVSVARNTGLEHASGELVMFVDSDDWIEDGIIEQMVKLMVSTEADLVTSDLERSDGIQPLAKQKKSHQISFYTKDEYLRLFFKIDSNEWVHFPVAKLYKKALLPQPLYPKNIRVGEDVIGTYYAIANANTIARLHKIGYWYYINPESVTSSFSQKDFDLISVWDKMVEITEGAEPDHEYAKLNRDRINFTLLFRLLTEVPSNERKEKYTEQENILRGKLKVSEKELLHSPIVFSRKIIIFLLCHCYPLMKFGGGLYIKLQNLFGTKITAAQRRPLS